MNSLLNWVSRNLLLVVLILVVGYLLLKPNYPGPVMPLVGERSSVMNSAPGMMFDQAASESKLALNQDSRITIQETSMSLLVEDVRESSEKVIDHAKSKGGFMVTASFSRPEESPYASVSVRVPTASLDESLEYYRGLAAKVTSENIYGTDVTEQYQDIEAQLVTLGRTLSKLNELLEQATAVEDILNVQREISNIQQQIDSYKGQQESLEQNAALTKVTVYLSTDELALPYVPDKSFRPNLIFKQAVRSLVDTFRDMGEGLIWLGVYSVIWLPLLVLGYFLIRRFSK